MDGRVDRITERRPYNAVSDFVDSHIAAGRGNKAAFVDPERLLTYGELQARSIRFANALRDLGIGPEQRVALKKDKGKLTELRIAFTGTNPRPVLLAGTAELCGGGLDERVIKGLDALVRDQIMPMKTTFTPGHYRRRVAGVLARRLLTRLFES